MKWNKKHILLTLFLPIQIGLVHWLSQKPEWIEQYYANGIYPYISSFFRTLLGWIPFSVGDLFIFGTIVYFLYAIYKLVRTRFKNFIPKLLRLTSFLSILYFCFYLFWGLNYFRNPLAKNLNYKTARYTTEELTTVTKTIIDKLNTLQFTLAQNDTNKVIPPYTIKKIYDKSFLAYQNLAKTYPQFKYEAPAIKSSLMSLLQTYNGTSGYLNPITGEAQVNDCIPKLGYPATACHEIAHQIGYAAENEANFIGFLATVSYDDPYFQYSGYRMAFAYCISEIRKRDSELSKELWKSLHVGILKDFRDSNAFWKSYQNPIEPWIKKGYSSYLKANNQTKGIASYNYVVDLLISYFLREHLSS